MKLFASDQQFFPPPDRTGPEGLLAIDDHLTTDRLLEAYSFGIFPWPDPDYPVLWFSPPERGVLDFSDLHVPKRLVRELKAHEFHFSWNKKFVTVIHECARAPRRGQSGTWITEEMERAYSQFHRAGYAHSLEVWQDGELAGGLYGVFVGGVFAAESMFYKISPASKAAVLELIRRLSEQGQTWMDVQMVTPLLKSFGAKYIPRADFLKRLEKSKGTAQPFRV